MHVNLLVQTTGIEETGKTSFQVVAYVWDKADLQGSITLVERTEFAQIPGEDINLNLWATSLLRGLVARMEETFLWTDQRPEAILMKNAIEDKQN